MIRKNNLLVSGAALILLLIPVVGASFFAPYDPTAQNRDAPLAPPTPIHFADSRGRFHFRPFVCRWVGATDLPGARGTHEDCSQASLLRFFVRHDTVYDGRILKSSRHLFGTDGTEQVFLLGTDEYGRDLFSRLLYGGQTSLVAGLLATGLSLGMGLVFGSIAGFFGSWVDAIVMRAAELFMALPWIYLLFAVRAFLPLSLDARRTLLLLIGVIGLVGWARPARLIRGVILSVKERNYIHAARGFGVSNLTILRHHILPDVYSVVFTQAGLLIPQYILAEVTLSFLGLGVGEPQPSWGNMLASLQSYYVLTAHWWMLASGLVLLPIFFLFYSFADSLQRRFQVPDLTR
jgi:peptide/nickel transport system permease protein